MRDSVRKGFTTFTTKFEGRVAWMYLDIKALVTTGVGNLIDPVDAALGLPFTHKSTGKAATSDEIRQEWTMLKGRTDLAQKGYKACEPITDLRLSDADIDALVLKKLDANDAVLKKTFPDFESWPADAQLAVHSMAWAMGPGFPAHWTNLTAALKAQDWAKAAANCKINETGNPGVKPRNDADVLLFQNAQAVKDKGLDAATLYYPGDAKAAAAPAPTGSGSGSSGTTGQQSSSGQSTGQPSGQATEPTQVASADLPTGDQPTGDQPTGDQPTGDQPTEDQPTEDQPTEDQPTEDQPTEDQPTEDQPTEDQPTEDQPTEDQPTEDQPTEDQPTEDQPTEDQPTEDQPTEDQPTEDQPTEDQPTEDQPTEDQPTEDQPTEDQPTEDQPTEDQPTEDQPTEDQPTEPSDDQSADQSTDDNN
ncbi:lysozyme family protein [Nocardioides ultimimeridianus]